MSVYFDGRCQFTSAVLRSDRSSFKRFKSSFLMCLGDCPTSSLTYGAFSKTGRSSGNLPNPTHRRHAGLRPATELSVIEQDLI